MNLNPNCCGSNCRSATGEVRVYPLGAGANLILCAPCFAHENRYRAGRVRDGADAASFPQVKWSTAAKHEEGQ